MEDRGLNKGFCCDVDKRSFCSDSLPSIHPLPFDQKVICGARDVGVSGGRGEIQTLSLNHRLCIKNNLRPQMANVNKIT